MFLIRPINKYHVKKIVLSDKGERYVLFNTSSREDKDTNNLFIGKMLYSNNTNTCYLLNNCDFGTYLGRVNLTNEEREKADNFQYLIDFWTYYYHLFHIYFLPSNFRELIRETFNNNKTLLRSSYKDIEEEIDGITEDKGLSNTSALKTSILAAFGFFNDKPNILAWILRMIKSNNNFCTEQILKIYLWLENYDSKIKDLSKHTLNAYKTNDDINHLFDEMYAIKIKSMANKIVSLFNTEQRKVLKNVEFTEKEAIALKRLYSLSPKKFNNLVRKISTLSSKDEIFELIYTGIQKSFDWNRDSLLSFIEESELACEVKYDKDNIIVLEVFDFQSIFKLAKSTNWCISKQKKYWDEYVSDDDRYQYIIYNFNEKEDSNLSIIGVTCATSGVIEYAHSFTNENLIDEFFEPYHNIYGILDYSIYPILKSFNLDMNVFVKDFELNYDWSHDDILEYFENYPMNIYSNVLFEDENKIVIMTNERNSEKLFGLDLKSFKQIIDFEENCPKFLIIFDLTKDYKDFSSIFVCKVIDEDGYEIVKSIYDRSIVTLDLAFSELCEKFELSEDIIMRPKFDDKKMYFAIIENDTYKMDSLIKKYGEDIIIQNNEINSEFYDLMVDYVTNEYSVKHLDILYNNNIKLSNVFTKLKVQ